MLSPIIDTSDSMYSIVLSESVLHHFSTHLNWFQPPEPVTVGGRGADTPPLISATSTYQLAWSHRNLVYCYPNGSSILSLPFVAVANFAGIFASTPDGHYSKGGDFVIQKFLASVLMAIMVVVVFHTGLLLLNSQTSLMLAIAFALGTGIWSTATRQLWSHTWLIFLEGWVVYLLLRYDEESEMLPAVLFASLLSWMYFARPTAAIPILCVTLFVLRFHRRKFRRFALTGVFWLVAFLIYSWFTFGDLVPGYYRSRLDFKCFWISLAANLVSPSRGFFIYVPSSALVLYSMLRHWSALPHRRLAALAMGVILVHLIVLGGYPVWWGGACFGARLMIDVLPWFVLLAILASAEAARRREFTSSNLGTILSILLITLSVAMNAGGAISRQCQRWNQTVDVDHHPERVFDWSYPQFAAAIVRPPSYPGQPSSERSLSSSAEPNTNYQSGSSTESPNWRRAK